MRAAFAFACVTLVLALGSAALAAPATAPQTERVSVSSGGDQGNRYSGFPSLSRSGRFVAFSSDATNLVPNDTNGKPDVFVHDRATGTTERVSVGSTGAQGNRVSRSPSISSDGRYVAFESRATNLVPRDTSPARDVYVRDLKRNETALVSIGPNGNHAGIHPAISGDGRSVVFSTFKKLEARSRGGDVFVRHLDTHKTERVSVSRTGGRANSSSAGFGASISANGRFVAFDSFASNLVSGDKNRRIDVFVRDLKRRVTKRIGGRAYDYGDTYAPAISGNGRFVSFQSAVFVSATSYGEGLFRRDLKTGATERVDVSPFGGEGNASSFPSSLSADGRIVVFNSAASNLVPGDTNLKNDVFIRDVVNHTTTRVSVGSAGEQARVRSEAPAISADGRFAGFQSTAALVPGDTNGKRDVFVRGPLD